MADTAISTDFELSAVRQPSCSSLSECSDLLLTDAGEAHTTSDGLASGRRRADGVSRFWRCGCAVDGDDVVFNLHINVKENNSEIVDVVVSARVRKRIWVIPRKES